MNLHYIPVHLQPYYRWLGFGRGDFLAAEAYYASAISLPLFYGLSEEHRECIVQTLTRAVQ